jgi:alkylation response protein AidB-like acyl-CoA dehydrogenase
VLVEQASPEARALVEQVERFGRERLDAQAIDANARIPPSVLSDLAELGLFGVTLPEPFGGSGLSLGDACAVIASLARLDRSVAVSVGLHLGLGTRGLVRWGSEAQHARYLPELASGTRIAAFSTTEPGAGSDLALLRTGVKLDGGQLLVRGEKSYVTNGGFAGLFSVAVASPGLGDAARGQSLLLVEPSDAGFAVQREEHKLGLKGSSTTGLVFDDCRLPMDRLLGAPGKGASMLAHILSWGRTLMSAGCCGAAAFALEKASAHVQRRVQFGKPLAAQEVVRDRLAQLHARVFAMEALVAHTSRQADDEALAVASLSAKVFCSEGAWHVCDEALQLHGALGFIEDTGLALVLRDVRVTRIFEGANDVLLTHLGASELARKRTLSADASEAERALVALVRQLEARHRLRIFRSPRLLHALGEATAWVEASTAALQRARGTGRPPERARAELIHAQALRVLASARALGLHDGNSALALGFEPPSRHPAPLGAQA